MKPLVISKDESVPRVKFKQGSKQTNDLVHNTRRPFAASMVIWILSGTPITSIFGNIQVWLVLGVVAQLIICVRRNIALQRAAPLALVAILYFFWTIAASASGMDGQFTGLFGQLSKILVVALPIIFLPGMRRGLVEVMQFVCWSALIIFGLRQAGLLAGFDIASIFQPFYDLTGIVNDRTILIFNFDIVEEATRNSGAFREPGMFAAAIIITFLLLLSEGTGYTRSEIQRRIILFGVTLLTTQSTMGVAAAPLLGILSLRYVVQRKAVRIFITPLLVLLIAPLLFILGSSHVEKVEQQVANLSTKKSSWYNTRFGNAYIDYEAIVERPLAGFGFSELGRPRNFQVYLNGEDLGLGNGLTGTAVKHGLIFTVLLYLIFLWRMIRLYRSGYSGLLGWVAFGMVLFSQQLILMPAAFTLLGSYGLSRRSKKQGSEPHQSNNTIASASLLA